MHDPIGTLARALDVALVGQSDAKQGLLLALLAREHAYLEGPPGCGKTRLAEALLRAAGARAAVLCCHRESGPAELLGGRVLRREVVSCGERIWSELVPGALLGAELALLDALSRAPGEALTPLLRILAQRRFGELALPLECAVATALPESDELFADPLEPAQLDRFAIQVRMQGLVGAQHWHDARVLLEASAAGPTSAAAQDVPAIDSSARHALQRRAAELPIGEQTRAGLLRVVARLRAAAGEQASLLSDRAFTRQATAILRAHAMLRGAPRVTLEDLQALRFMLARRVPEAVLVRAQTLIAEVVGELRDEARSGAREPSHEHRDARSGAGARADRVPGETPTSSDVIASMPASDASAATSEASTAAVEPLLRALAGRLDRGVSRPDEDPGGQPRRYRWLRRLDEILDADPLDAMLLIDGSLPGPARVYRRERDGAGGALAVLRDVSASMEGVRSHWAGQLVSAILHACARRRMRIGYLEFNHTAEPFRADGRFFHRRYRSLQGLAARARAEGRTSYEAPLRAVLAEFRRSSGRNRHIVLLTDGVPVLGDPAVRRERALARELGVRVHTVFLGPGACPRVLEEISAETGGLRFFAQPAPDGKLGVRERREAGCATS